VFTEEHKLMLNHLMDEIRKTPDLSFLNDPNIQGGELKIYADASNMGIGDLITVRGKDGIEHPLSFHSKTFPDQYRLKHINILETLALTMVVRKFKGYIQGHVPTLVADSQCVKHVMEMSGK
jgi:hypothetical protein